MQWGWPVQKRLLETTTFKECSTPSTVPLGGGDVAPSLGGRFHLNMLKDKYRANRNKGITNIFIDYSSIAK